MIYLLRHGEIKGASIKRFIGQTDVGLSQAGLDLAALWQKRLSRINMDHVFASPLSRCIDMATMVSGFEKHAITLMDGLKEIDALFSIPQDYGCLNIIDNGQKTPRVQEIN